MKVRGWWKLVAVVSMLATFTGCTNDGSPTGPEPVEAVSGQLLGPVLDLVGGVVDTLADLAGSLLGAVVRTIPLQSPVTVVQYVGPQGGVLSGGGVELRIPAGALKERTRLTLIVPASSYVEAEFLPHGLNFARPVQLRFDMRGSAGAHGSSDSMVGTFFTAPIVDGLIRVDEAFPATLENGIVRFDINHFSSYAPARRGYTAAGG
ncbi:MAG: hypothetical protein L0271_28265 [Gemmatimonadetes bacterium]|nr:hypothetical protein [Gemmatimonadota bacterium]